MNPPAAAAAPAAPTALLARVKALCASGRVEAAAPLLAAARRLGAPRGEADLLEAALLLRRDRVDEALALLDEVVARDPTAAEPRLSRARAKMLADDPVGAAIDAAEAVVMAPHDAPAKAMLGIAMAELGHLDDAVACLGEAVRAEPANPGFRLALARALDCAGDNSGAEAVLDEGIARAGGSVQLWGAAAHLAISQADFLRAVRICRAARAAGVMDACLIGMQGHALSCLGDHMAASDAYEQALQFAPEDSYVRHLVASAGRRPADDHAPEDYVRTVFDGYARRFEAHLLDLGYRVPGLLRAALLAHRPAIAGPVLDLGCGTGLAAVALSDLPLGPWHGIDLSEAMLAEARTKGLYTTLRCGALPTALRQAGQDFALAIAADMLCYVGTLAPMLEATRDRLAEGGLLAASFEALDPAEDEAAAEWELRPTGRYAHREGYVRAATLAAGFEIVVLRRDILRIEQDTPVPGLIALLRKPASAS